ncbi:MAG: type pilus assembly protein PilM [Thermoleophilaceae bacterium]|nr:type pilus assembly protein PilM [Thermoleophilaceae bacterium]
MASKTAVGLDIGTSSVRAAQVSFGKGVSTLDRFGQVALPAGAVRDGEVIDSGAVSAALKQLWEQTKFTTKKVVLGVANQKVVVRQVDLPWLPGDELRQSLPFQVQDYIPIPVEQAILDYHALEELVDDSGARILRVLLVAASRDMVNSIVGAVTAAGLKPTAVDLTSFALLRSLVNADELGMATSAEALVDIGANVTNIVVHQGGSPRFVRILLMGGGDVTEALAERAGVPLEHAESLKQSVGMGIPSQADAHPAARVIESVGGSLVEEIRGSLDYYSAQPAAVRIGRIILTGGGSRLGGFADRLSASTRLPVELGTALSGMKIGKTGLSSEQLDYITPLASVPVGLALGVNA